MLIFEINIFVLCCFHVIINLYIVESCDNVEKIKIMIYSLLIIVVSFGFMSNMEAKRVNNVWCMYEAKGCTLALKKNLSGSNGSNAGWSIDTSKTTKDCKQKGNTDAKHLLPNVYNDKSFYYNLNYNGAQQNTTCPDLYVGTTLQNCWKSKNDEYSKDHGAKCWMLYTENNKDGTRVKVTGERKTKDDIKKEAQDGGGTAAKIKALKKMSASDKKFNCKQLLGDKLIGVLNIIFTIIRVATPILLIVLTMVDFMTAIVTEDGSKHLKEPFNKFIKRTIAAVLVFLVPTIIDFLLNITGITDGTCGL